MTTLQPTLRSIRDERESRRDHLDIFREFLRHLERAARSRPLPRTSKAAKARGRRR